MSSKVTNPIMSEQVEKLLSLSAYFCVTIIITGSKRGSANYNAGLPNNIMDTLSAVKQLHTEHALQRWVTRLYLLSL